MIKAKAHSDKTVWAEYKPGFTVEIRYTPRAKLRRMMEECKVREWDSRTHQPLERTDDEKFYRKVAKEIVVNWRGLTPDVLRSMIECESYPGGEELYSEQACVELLTHAYDFDRWVQHIMGELELFEAARRAEETKNSWPSPASG